MGNRALPCITSRAAPPATPRKTNETHGGFDRPTPSSLTPVSAHYFQYGNFLTPRIVGHTLFSTDLSAEAGRLGPAITTALRRANLEAEAPIRMPLWIPTPSNLRFHRAQRWLDDAIGNIIAEPPRPRRPAVHAHAGRGRADPRADDMEAPTGRLHLR